MTAQAAQAKRALVVGLGSTGVSAARYLASRGYEVAVTDSRARPPGLETLQREVPAAAQFVGGFSESALAHADIVVLSPGVSPAEDYVAEARRRGLEVVGDIELFARTVTLPVVAITGSNGKSTVTTLVGLMAERAGRRVAVGGNIGTPALDLLEQDVQLYVLELSSFQLETTESLVTVAAAVLNLSPDHMDRYADLGEYAAAKARIFGHCDTAVINRDDALVREMGAAAGSRISFGLDAPPTERDFGLREHAGATWIARGGEMLMPVSEVLLPGRHNLANVLAALALADAAGLPQEPALEVLQEFRGLPHRTEFVAEIDGVIWLNDSKGTNVGATLAAVRGFTQPLVLIAGGDGKGADFAELAEVLTGRARAVVLIGRDAGRIAAALGNRVPVHFAEHMDAAVRRAREAARAGDIVLLSPACASFDMFENFEHRGRAFATAVREMAA